MRIDQTTVLDLSLTLPGAYATMLLGDLGAEVIKVEKPPAGEFSRNRDPRVDGTGYRFLQRNRNKQSIVIDLKTEAGLTVFKSLAREADVLLESFRPGVVDRLGIDYKSIKQENPDIIYCSLTGYGQTGPYADWPGHDLNYLGVSGLLSLVKDDQSDKPVIPNFLIGDVTGGLFTAFSILGALSLRETAGGQYIDSSITDILFSFLVSHSGEYFGNDGDWDPKKARTSGIYPCYNVYETADEEYLTVCATEEKFWRQLCEAIGEEELISEHLRESGREKRIRRLEKRFCTKPLDYWLEKLGMSDVPCAPVNSVEDAMSGVHVKNRELIEEIDFNGNEVSNIASPFHFSSYDTSTNSPPPKLGEDTITVLEDIGLSEKEIISLYESGVVF